ncbi:MAG: multifunctional oxoglutarate decarboxylase/oxoglutarate dehydrogenase thiamine pyrophosphate-binding subunit/dihydrolipoyllysine-residue succinyltransferase subunit [Gemmatimonadales bacterium]
MFENVFETVNSGFVQALYEDYLRDPASVPSEWRELFENGLRGETPTETPQTPQSEQSTSAAEPAVAASIGSSDPIVGPALRLLQNMEASLSVPTATSFRDIDVAQLWDVRRSLNQALRAQNKKLSFTHIIGWAIVCAARTYPTMAHAVVEVEGTPHRVAPGAVNLGLAVDVEAKDGTRKLLVPVIKHAQSLSFGEFHEEYERLVAGARGNKLMPDSYMGATITLTNPGTIGTVASVPRLMKGQGSIVATGAIRMVGGSRIMTVTSTYDHRIIQGAESGMFLQTIDRLLQGDDGFYEDLAAAMNGQLGAAKVATPTGSAESVVSPVAPVSSSVSKTVDATLLSHVAAAMSVVKAHRTHGYLEASLDPLGRPSVGDPALHPENLGLTPEMMAQIPAQVLRVYVEGDTMAEVLPRLREVYSGNIAYEIEHIGSHEQRLWLREVIESGKHQTPPTDDERRKLLTSLIRTSTFERFLQRTYLGQKRFGIEGLDVLVPILELALELAGRRGARDVVLGMAHRGRLNILTHIVGVPYASVLAEFEGGYDIQDTLASGRGTGDVKYHYGASGAYQAFEGNQVYVVLMPNPSHLEAVNPVVEGHVRASQTDRTGVHIKHDPNIVVPILLHGDAAFAAQGVVAETLNVACLDGYDTGGTLHIICNNQIGFTTDPSQARSTEFSSDLAKGFDIPIIHVNADDPEACLSAVRLAMMYREVWHDDCVIDVIGYRRLGHNEGDEPRYTQPTVYARIDAHPDVTEIYATQLIGDGVIDEQAFEREKEERYQELTHAHEALKHEKSLDHAEEPVRLSGEWRMVAEPSTAVAEKVLRQLNDDLLQVPDGFAINPKLKKVLDRRTKAFEKDGPLDWAHAEALALSSLLLEGNPVRMVGQDVERGTFSQRHLRLHDYKSGDTYAPIQNLSGANAPFELHNTPLSEYAALGFEYGYSVAATETLVVWEAQFGDFVNGAEIIIDQFIIAGLAKWGQTSRLALLLPHGYEGQGPEHSSARLERFLALGAESNIRVANCSTPAQYFHILRRQAKHLQLRPLILMTPKSLLRHPKAVSHLADLTTGLFQFVLDDPTLPAGRDEVTRIVFCSGKVYYDAITAQQRSDAKHVSVARIELLYPFPTPETSTLIANYPNVRELVWLQEEPTNMGARKWIVPRLEHLAPEGVTVRYVARPERSSPAEGYLKRHQNEQARLVADVLA